MAGGRSSRSAPDCAPRQTYRPGREVQIFLNNKSSKNTKGHTSRTRSKKSKGKSVAAGIGKGILTVMLVAIIFCCVVAGVMTLYVVNFVKPYNISLNESDLKSTSIIYAKDSASNSQTALAEISGSENRIWVSLSGTPKNLRNAIISTEDMRFNEHEGVDFRRTVYSFANMIFHFNKTNQGGSTITQQLIKNIQGNISERTPAVKLREIITAVDVEKKYSKDQILEAYMNIIPLGNSCYGVQTASNMYFGKDVKDIDLAQAALLAGIIQAPESYEPYKHMTQAQVRQKYVLKNMLTQKMITNAEYTAAINEKITLTAKKTTVRGWFVDQVIRDVIADLQTQKGYSAAVAENYVYTGGLRIYTTEDTKVQAAIDAVYTANSDDYFKAWDGTKYQSSMLICDYTGKILGMVGSTGAKTGNMVLNRSTMSYRPAGSSFKPICTYALAIEKGLVNWSTLIMDSPSENVNGSQWPKDDEPWTNANMTIDTALTQSRNAVAVRVCKDVGVTNCFNFLTQKLGFSESLSKDVDSSGDSDAYSLGLTLGMFSKKSKGASAREMAASYQIFGNGGIYYKPYTYSSVTDASGNIILQNRPVGIQAISSDTSTIMNRLMQNVVKSGTGTGAQLSNCPVAGKTGTTPDNYDRWWVGCTPEYVGAVWTGYDTPRSIGRGDNPSVTIWHAVFEKLEANRDASKDFPYSGTVVQEAYDPATGKVAASGAATGWYSTSDPAVTALSGT